MNEISSESTLSGKVAIVTGAGSGVGRATALALAERGVRVGLIGRRQDPLQNVASEFGRPGQSLVLPADVGDENQVGAVVKRVLDSWGGVDMLVCCAAVGVYGPIADYSLADWEATFRTNVSGVFLTARALLPSMRESGGGRIIAIGSGAGKQGYANLGAYSASKFALLGFMESLAAEVGADGIKVATINPGSILTGFAGGDVAAKRRQIHDGRKYLEPEDVAGAICYLLEQSDRAWTQEMNLWPF